MTSREIPVSSRPIANSVLLLLSSPNASEPVVADVVETTSNHRFPGDSVSQAISLGCKAVAPRKLIDSCRIPVRNVHSPGTDRDLGRATGGRKEQVGPSVAFAELSTQSQRHAFWQMGKIYALGRVSFWTSSLWRSSVIRCNSLIPPPKPEPASAGCRTHKDR